MRKVRIKRIFLFLSIVMALSVSGCVKDTYNMQTFSKQAHISPTLSFSAVKGDISLSDAVKSNDTIVYDQNKFVTLVFKKNAIIDLKLSDFAKGTITKTAIIDPFTVDLNINDVLSRISGDFMIANPKINLTYTNSFPDSVKINLKATGKRIDKSVDLNLSPFGLVKPNTPVQQEVTATYSIDRNNSNLPALVSLPPEFIDISGTATLSTTVKSNPDISNAIIPPRLTGSMELEIPMELKTNNLQFTYTVDNFLKNGSNSDNPINAENFQFLKILLLAKNGFPLGATVKMDLYDSDTHTIKNSVEATGVILAAPVDGNGKANGITESSTTIEFTKTFFSFVNLADKIVFRFTLNSSGNGTQFVKIYSDNRINFTAAVVLKPDIKLN